MSLQRKRSTPRPARSGDTLSETELQRQVRREQERADRRAARKQQRTTDRPYSDSRKRRTDDPETVMRLLNNPTKHVGVEELRATYSYVTQDLRSMGLLALGLMVVLVLLAQLI